MITHLLKRIFLHREKDQTNNFSPFLCKRPFDHRKEFLKNSQFHFKGFHFKSTSSGSFNKVWWKSRNHTEIRNPSEAYLEPSQRSTTEPFRVNSWWLLTVKYFRVRLAYNSFLSRFSMLKALKQPSQKFWTKSLALYFFTVIFT